MSRNKIYAIVEGHAEAGTVSSTPAVKVLIQKILTHHQLDGLFFPCAKPWRMASCGDFFEAGRQKLEHAIEAHRSFDDCAALLILVDADTHCPKESASDLVQRIKKNAPYPFSILVVLPKCEYEAWFLASLATIHPGQYYLGPVEEKNDPKGWLNQKFGYEQIVDQANYTRRMDPELILSQGSSRSFGRLINAFDEFNLAFQQGQTIVTPA